MQPIVSVTDLSKTYASGFQALKNVNLDIQQGEIDLPTALGIADSVG